MSLITSASTLLQIYTWFFEIPALILNILLIFCIHREKRTDNRFRKFNCIFLYFVYSTTCLTVLFPLLHPTLIPARDLIYIVFIGPMADIFSIPMLKFLYCLLVGLASFQASIPPIVLAFKWLVVQKRVKCMVFYPKTIGSIFLLCSILLSIPGWIYLMFKNPSAKLQIYSEKSHEDAVWKLTGRRGYEHFVIDWTFCYPLLMLKLPYFLFFIVCIIAHRFYMKSIRHISNDCIDLGYNYTCNINRAFLSISFQIFIFIALPFLILDFTIFIRWELGVRALPVTFGCICTCLTTSITLFVHFRAYRRQVGYLFIALLRQNNGNFPIFISNQNHQSTHFQLSVMA